MKKIQLQTTCKKMLADVFTPVSIYLRVRDLAILHEKPVVHTAALLPEIILEISSKRLGATASDGSGRVCARPGSSAVAIERLVFARECGDLVGRSRRHEGVYFHRVLHRVRGRA